MNAGGRVRQGVTVGIMMMGLWFSATADAAGTRWYQVPARAVWVDVPEPWSLGAAKERPILRGKHPKGAQMFVSASAQPVAEALEAMKGYLQPEYPRFTFKRAGAGVLSGAAHLDQVELPLTVTARRVASPEGELTVVVAVVRPSTAPKAMASLSERLAETAAGQWKRPGGARVGVGKPGFTVRQPNEGWLIVGRRGDNTAELISEDKRAGFQMIWRPQQKSPRALLDRYAKGIDPGGVTWRDDEPWRPKGVDAALAKTGIRRVGTMKAEEGGKTVHYHAELYVLGGEGGVLLLLATVNGERVDDLLEPLAGIAASVTSATE